MRRLNLIGQVFGSWTVRSFAGISKSKETLWECVCKCGSVKVIPGRRLNGGGNKSCGCASICITHHKSQHRLYKIYKGMKVRCYNKNNPLYPLYGGRGITICSVWLSEFDSFYTWSVANGYSEGLTIDRINVNGNYGPTNCRWATRLEQSKNTRRSIFVQHEGKTYNITDLCNELGIHRTMMYRIMKAYTIGHYEAIKILLSRK